MTAIRSGQFVNTPGSNGNGIVSSTLSRFTPALANTGRLAPTAKNSQPAPSFDRSGQSRIIGNSVELLPFESNPQVNADSGQQIFQSAGTGEQAGGNVMATMMSMMMQMMQMMMSLLTLGNGGAGGKNPLTPPDEDTTTNPNLPVGEGPTEPKGNCKPHSNKPDKTPDNPKPPVNTNPNPVTPNPPTPAPPTPVEPEPETPPADQTNTATPDIDRNVNFRNLSKEERSEAGLNDADRAVLHLWGRQVISRGFQDGSIQLNVAQKPNDFTQAERDLVKELTAQDEKDYGGITGKTLDKKFFAVMQKMSPDTPVNTSRWANTEAKFAKEPLNIVSDINTLSNQTGLSKFDQGVMRLWGHDPLMNGGKSDGSILAYTIGNTNALDNAANPGNKNPGDMNIDDIAQGLLDADMASDGVRNGDSLQFAFGRVLDKIYLGGTNNTMDAVQKNADAKAQANGRTKEQVARDISTGVQQAMKDVAKMVKNHPVMTTVGVGGLAAASAICPFMGGLAVGGAGLAAGSKFLKGKGNSASEN